MSTTTDKGHYIQDLTKVRKVDPSHVFELELPTGSFHITGADLYNDISNYINATSTIQGLVDSVQELRGIIDGLRARIEALEARSLSDDVNVIDLNGFTGRDKSIGLSDVKYYTSDRLSDE